MGRSVLDHITNERTQRINKPGQVFSRIYIEDLADSLYASMCRPTPGEIFNVTDDRPASSREVIEYGCQLIGCCLPPLVPFEGANISPIAREFYQDNRRVSNQKLKDYLNVSFRYPSFEEGLSDIAKQMQG
jgi:nucleoside-diphosphate-sugar epimerase